MEHLQPSLPQGGGTGRINFKQNQIKNAGSQTNFGDFSVIKKQNRLKQAVHRLLVEAGGVEPPSENPSSRLSTSVVYLHKVPALASR